MEGSNNNINVLQRSSIFYRLAESNAREVHYEINDHQYNKKYYLDDGIYLPWSTSVKTILNPQEEKYMRFVREHVACRKDVEQAVSVLPSRWAIVLHPART
jgi:hypothetical protein